MSKLDSLYNAKINQVETAIDSIAYHNEKDSLAILRKEQELLDKQKSHSLDSLNDVLNGIEEFQEHKAINNQIVNGGMLNGLGMENLDALENEIFDLTADVVNFEANTNVLENYEEFQEMYKQLVAIHDPYQSGGAPFTFPIAKAQGEWQFMAGLDEDISKVRGTDLILNDNALRYQDMNGLDKVFGDAYSLPDLNLQNTTLARLYASDVEIRELINGRGVHDENGEIVWMQGFNDIVNHFDLLSPKATLFPNVKWLINEPIGSTDLLTSLLKIYNEDGLSIDNIASLDQTSPEANKFYSDDYPGISTFVRNLNQLSTAQSKVVSNRVSNIIDKIYNKTTAIQKSLPKDFFSKFESYKKRFGDQTKGSAPPGAWGIGDWSETYPGEYFGIDPLADSTFSKLKGKQDKLINAQSQYKWITGEQYDLNETLNQISLVTLNKELDELPDYEKTDAFNNLIIQLTSQLKPADYSPAE